MMKYSLQDLIDIEHFQELQNRLNEIYSFPSSIIDNDGHILTATAWQEICTKFHRQSKEAQKICIKSDQYIKDHIHEAHPTLTYRCPHGLVDNATPIIIDGVHYGNFFTGQFFLEEPNLEFFQAQAQKYGFDEKAYLQAVKKVPIWTKKQLDNYLFFIQGLIAVISETGLKRLREIEHRKQIEKSENRYRSILKASLDGYWLMDTKGKLLEVNDAYCRMSGYSEKELLSMYISDFEIIETPELVSQHMKNVVLKKSDRFESKHRRKDGTVFDVEVSLQFRPEEGGQCFCFLRDITDRKSLQDRLESLWSIAQMTEAGPKVLFNLVLEKTQELTGSRYSFFGFINDAEDQLEVNAWSKEVMNECRGQDQPIHFPIAKAALWSQAVLERKPLFWNDYNLDHSRKKGLPDGHVPIKNFLCVPIVRNEKVIALAAVANKDSDYTSQDASQVQAFVSNILLLIEKRIADEALQKSDERLKLALDSVSDAVWDWRVDTGEVYFSSRWYTMLGYEAYQLPQNLETWRRLLHPDDLPESEATVLRHLKYAEPFEIEYRMRTKENQWRWILARGKAVERNDQGKAVRMLGTHMDITERKQSEMALKHSELKWRNILVNTPQIGISINTSAEITFVNEHFLALTGWKENEVMERNWFDLFIPENVREDVRKVFHTVMGQKDTLGFSNFENEILGKSGQVFNVAWSNVLTKDAEGNVVDLTCLGVDLTERRHSEDKLRKSEIKYRTMMEAIKDPVYICSEDFIIQYMNQAMIDRVGRDATGELCYQALHGFDKKCRWCKYGETFQAGHAEKNIFSPLDKCSFNVSTTVFVNESGSLSKLSVFRDTTELIELQKRLQQAHKMEAIGNLAGGIAHDFNNILFPIIGMSEMLMEDLSSGSLEHKYAHAIYKAGHRAKELVAQILAFSRQSDQKKMPIRFRNILEEVLKLCRATIPANIKIEQKIQRNCGFIMGNATQLHQVAMNLITNAYHAVQEKNGKIIVALEEIKIDRTNLTDTGIHSGKYLLFTVSDDGTGMTDKVKNKIFEPYFTTKEQGKGTGLGLAVVYGIVKEYGGEIEVETQIGSGTIFSVYLPLMSQSENQGAAEIKTEIKMGHEHILLVDDDAAVANLEQQILERLGYQITMRTGSLDAVEVFRSNPDAFDIVITDMTMPNMTGDQLAEEILSIKPDIPIVICTGFSERINKEQAEAIGVKGFLMKPVVKSDFASMVRKVLDDAKSENKG